MNLLRKKIEANKLIITKADKENDVVVSKIDGYIKKLENIISDTSKFEELDSDPTQERENYY